MVGFSAAAAERMVEACAWLGSRTPRASADAATAANARRRVCFVDLVMTASLRAIRREHFDGYPKRMGH